MNKLNRENKSRLKKTGKQSYHRVTQTFATPNDVLYDLTLTTASGKPETLGVTGNHPFWKKDKGWTESDLLKVGDSVQGKDGTWLKVVALQLRADKATGYNLEVEGDHSYFVGDSGAWVHNTGCLVPVAKFRDYIFKQGATHGKDIVFRELGYGAEHSEDLVRLYSEQGIAKFASGEYTFGKLDQFGQRINIEIELPGIGSATGKTSYLRSGWMIRENGGISLNTPFSGFTR